MKGARLRISLTVPSGGHSALEKSLVRKRRWKAPPAAVDAKIAGWANMKIGERKSKE